LPHRGWAEGGLILPRQARSTRPVGPAVQVAHSIDAYSVISYIAWNWSTIRRDGDRCLYPLRHVFSIWDTNEDNKLYRW